MRIEHIALNHSDPESSARWYVENLDMELVKASDKSPFEHFLADKEKQGLIEMYNNPAAPVPDYASTSPFVLHIAFSVEDIEAARDKLLTAGATAEGDITKRENGDQLAFLRDPWGVALQLVQRGQPLI